MRIQVVNFNIEGINHDDFLQIADTAAPAFAEVPGLVSKIWLCDQENNTYGGVYTWEMSKRWKLSLKVNYSSMLLQITQILSTYP